MSNRNFSAQAKLNYSAKIEKLAKLTSLATFLNDIADVNSSYEAERAACLARNAFHDAYLEASPLLDLRVNADAEFFAAVDAQNARSALPD